MCYSALVIDAWKEFARKAGIHIPIYDYVQLFQDRLKDPVRYRLPRGFDLEFAETDQIRELIAQYRREQVTKLESEIFSQRKRLADAERKLAVKETKAAVESKRIATNKVDQALGKLALLTDFKRRSNDYRIFPRSYAPVIVMREGQKVLVPARYLCRQPGAPPFMDDKLSGNYNARRDNITKFWRKQFGATHAVMAISSFFENVAGPDGANQVLQFNPQPAGLMWIACLCSEWSDAKTGERLLSFAAITDEPPAEVSAAGHDRMIVSLNPDAVDHWLAPQGRSDDELQAILDDRQKPYYEHRLAA